MKKIITIFLFCKFFNLFAQNPIIGYDNERKFWVDSIMQSLSLEQKIGQLFMVAAYTDKGQKHEQKIKTLIEDYGIGGLIFFKGTPKAQVSFTNMYQKKSNVPLMIGLDAEWGLGMRLKNSFSYPWAMTMAAVQDDDLIRKMGMQIAKHCKRIGVHINFAPVVDINTNPENPIIGNRAFGSHRQIVSKKAIAYSQGMQSQNILACAKHFAGHGDTSKDSHLELPIIKHSKKRILYQELYPFRQIIKSGIASIMVGHLQIPVLDKIYPASISQKIVNNLLKNKMAFGGLVFTDALNMKAVSSHYPAGELDVKAFMTGNDVLLFSENVPLAVKKIKQKIQTGEISISRLNYSVKKILTAKYWVGLNKNKVISQNDIQRDIKTVEDKVLYRKIVQKSITLLRNKNNILPISNNSQKIALLTLSENNDGTPFFKSLKKMHSVEQLNITKENYKKQLQKTKKYDRIIIGVHKSSEHPWKKYKLSIWEKEIIKLFSENNKVILNVFASPYSLLDLEQTMENVEAVILSYQNNKLFQEISAQMIFGAKSFEGKLPVHINDEFHIEKGEQLLSVGRLGFSIPEMEGMSTQKLLKVDTLINISIQDSVMPGAQVLVAKNGNIVYQKSYGYHTYNKKRKVKNTDIYDLASITKIVSTSAIMMKMVEEGTMELDDILSLVFKESKGTDKYDITLREMFSHYSKLKPWLPIHNYTIDENGEYIKGFYSNKKSDTFPLKVADKLYIHKSFKDTIINRILKTELKEKKQYKYSGIPFVLMKYIIEKHYKKGIDEVANELFYKPLGAITLTYNPLEKFDESRIPPTQNDTVFRKQLIKGYVHDMIASLQGGLGGNAGLFSSAYDLAKMMQMLLNGGIYGGRFFLEKEIINEFNTRYYDHKEVRRGIGFDKPQFKGEGSTCGCVSHMSFGHLGFTGTMAWADPEEKLVYIFLSNRIYPNMSNNKISKRNLRTKIQQLVYESILK